MSKYGKLSRTDGHSKWFLQKTLAEHDRSMDHPWMQMIYKQSFTIKQYSAWLARNHAVFAALEPHLGHEVLRPVHDEGLLRTAALEADLSRLLGAEGWRHEAAEMARSSPAAQRYLAHLEKDACSGWLLLAHHFLQYNAVLSGGAYLGKMVSEKLCVPHGASGVQFYAFAGVDQNKGPARVQEYLRDFDRIEIGEADRDLMLAAMRRIYEDTDVMMQEVFELNPAPGLAYNNANAGADAAQAPEPIPEAERLELSLAELHGYTGADGGRILLSLAGELVDVSLGRELYGPGGSYGLLAGRDVTRCLTTMSLDPDMLDDVAWEPDCDEDEQALKQWREKLKAKYPVAGRLHKNGIMGAAAPGAAGGLRLRGAPAAAPAAGAAAVTHAGGDEATQMCPISGKEGAGCPMAAFMGSKAPSKPAAPPTHKPGAPAGTFMAGKSLIESVNNQSNNSDGDSLLQRLCPLHWDNNTVKVLMLVAGFSWVSGIVIGWNLHREIMT